MNFNTRSNLAGTHAFLSPSKPAWLNYDDDKLDATFFKSMDARRGTELHELAYNLIRLGVNLPRNSKTLNQYVNDAIGYRMTPEALLYYSDNCYGHADTCGFRDNTLRIHDLKNGVNEASFAQLEIYAALFCLEYKFNPFQIAIELRIYQNDGVKVAQPEPDVIVHVMDKIRVFSRRIDELKLEVSS